jgi:hypothetical protein
VVPSPRGDALVHVDRVHHGTTPSALGTAERSGGVTNHLTRVALSGKVVFLVDLVRCLPGFPLRRTEPYLQWISLFVVPKNKSSRFELLMLWTGKSQLKWGYLRAQELKLQHMKSIYRPSSHALKQHN